ncbi:ATP-binding protein [Heliorestis convoluta]|uniref:AAA family ATPase n=1 Tax=Heliorestis convoluta TaxID=356322 RepID=A0A5Q2MYR5_9FIRM|nr:AAA family ATPase [Heliorestis convoluta]QGG46296.1 AAA family ATPase [Heliorestis convoluta]
MVISIHFTTSFSKNFLNIYRHARKHSTFRKKSYNGRAGYQVELGKSPEDLVFLCEIWKVASSDRNCTILADGEEVRADTFDLIVECLRQCLKSSDRSIYCDGQTRDYREHDGAIYFRPGCRFLVFDDFAVNDSGQRWYRFGTVDSEGIFYVDKSAILSTVEQMARQNKCYYCPLLEWKDVERQVFSLPDTIDAEQDSNWIHLTREGRIVGVTRKPSVSARGRADMDTSVTGQYADVARRKADEARNRPSERSGQEESAATLAKSENLDDIIEPVKLTKKTSYQDVGGLKEEIRLLREAVELPLRYPELVQDLGIKPPKGVLLYGPPGCGKTLLAQAVAQEVEATFFSVKGPEFLSPMHGQSEKRLRQLFAQAEKKAPSIIFFDEIDAFAFDRSRATATFEATLVAQFLSLMDGFDRRGQVVVIATTNRLDILDRALLRPGRFDYRIRVRLPELADREQILRLHTTKMPLDEHVQIQELAEKTSGYTGADIAALCAKAALIAVSRALGQDMNRWPAALDKDISSRIRVTTADFTEALQQVVPSVDEREESL